MSCHAPFYVDNPLFPYRSHERLVPAPCGKCHPCLQRRSSGWAFRLMQQELISEGALFVTLTYDNENVPLTPKKFMTLNYSDVQKFYKRLRKRHEKRYSTGIIPEIKYYTCGEYGSKTYRPHYHAIIFNASAEDIEKAWTQGLSHFGTVTGASIAYTTKYIHKGKMIPVHHNDDRKPERAGMSKKLGLNYLTPEVIAFHQQNIDKNYVVVDGFKKAMPRYYREKIWSEDERLNQSQYVQRLISEKERKQKEDYVLRTGEAETYDKSMYEVKKHSLLTHNQNEKDKRTAF